MPERFEIYIVYKRRYINTLSFVSFSFVIVTAAPLSVSRLSRHRLNASRTRDGQLEGASSHRSAKPTSALFLRARDLGL